VIYTKRYINRLESSIVILRARSAIAQKQTVERIILEDQIYSRSDSVRLGRLYRSWKEEGGTHCYHTPAWDTILIVYEQYRETHWFHLGCMSIGIV